MQITGQCGGGDREALPGKPLRAGVRGISFSGVGEGQEGVSTETLKMCTAKNVHRWPSGGWVTVQGMGVRGVKAGEEVSGCSRRFPNSIPTVASQCKSGLSFTPRGELGESQDFVSNKNIASKSVSRLQFLGMKM